MTPFCNVIFLGFTITKNPTSLFEKWGSKSSHMLSLCVRMKRWKGSNCQSTKASQDWINSR